MKPETAKALIELCRAAEKQITGKEPTGPIVVTLCGRHADRVERAVEATEHQRSSATNESSSLIAK